STGVTGAMIPAVITTVVLSLVALVMVWRCWNLPPVPVIRLWAVGWAAMAANVLDQFWRAEAWKKECERLQLQLPGRRQPQRQSKMSTAQGALILDAAARFVTRTFDADILVATFAVCNRVQIAESVLRKIAHTRSVFPALVCQLWLVRLPLEPQQFRKSQASLNSIELHSQNRVPLLIP